MQAETAAVADATGDQRVAYANHHQRYGVARDKDGRQKVAPLHALRRPIRPSLLADVHDLLDTAAETGSRRSRRLGGDVRSVSGLHQILELPLLVEDRPRRHYRRRKRPYQHDYDARHFAGHVTSQGSRDIAGRDRSPDIFRKHSHRPL